MSLPTESEALTAVEAARAALAAALDVLRQARGLPDDIPCQDCDGTGKWPLAEAFGGSPDDPCDGCNGSGRQKAIFPWIVEDVEFLDRPAIMPGRRGATWVAVRPCDAACGGKTYLGWLLGDIALSVSVSFNRGTLTVGKSMYNPAIFVPDLGRVVFGRGSWWGAIKSPDDLRRISDADIGSVWYVRMMKDLGCAAGSDAGGAAGVEKR